MVGNRPTGGLKRLSVCEVIFLYDHDLFGIKFTAQSFPIAWAAIAQSKKEQAVIGEIALAAVGNIPTEVVSNNLMHFRSCTTPSR